MSLPADARLLAKLQQWRARPAPDLSFKPLASAMGADLRRRARTLGHAGEAWIKLVPAELLPHSTLVALARGVLTVRVADASARFELARWLRDGGEHAIIRATPGALIKIKLLP